MRHNEEMYILDEHGHPVRVGDSIDQVMLWTEWWCTNADERRVAVTQVAPRVTVSTIFLGLDFHPAPGSGEPILWETRVYGGKYDRKIQRYTSRADALVGHAWWVSIVTAALPLAVLLGSSNTPVG